ncbi:hypothetical protein NPIL_87191 [Nephila pilipes]|uniref:Uncharacterized protein n=1 Tax=Nephila pilipes TaxID=299642 RepID=A0A8X6QBA8_NEPPI|nr:hypothetical protein NPIL_87191 [Nephila pilipes]
MSEQSTEGQRTCFGQPSEHCCHRGNTAQSGTFSNAETDGPAPMRWVLNSVTTTGKRLSHPSSAIRLRITAIPISGNWSQSITCASIPVVPNLRGS